MPALVTGAVGIAVLRWFLRDPGARADESGAVYALPRRAFLTGTAVTGAGSLAAVLGAQFLSSGRQPPSTVTLPPPARPLAALPAGLDVPGIAPWVTPNADFYWVDVSLIVPGVDLNGWRLSIDGMVDRSLSITWSEPLAMPMIEKDITLNCVSNEVGGPYIGGARWLGVRVQDLLARAGVRPGADQVLSRSVDGFTVSTPVQALTDGRDALIAVGMNGEPLPAEHGFPARMITPGLYGYVGATKWLTQLTLTTYAKDQGLTGPSGDGPNAGRVKPSSRIDTPRPFARPKTGQVMIAGEAWAQHIGVMKVQVRGRWPLAGRRDRPGRRNRLLAAMEVRPERDAWPALPGVAGDRQHRSGPVAGTRGALPGRLLRSAQRRRDGRLTASSRLQNAARASARAAFALVAMRSTESTGNRTPSIRRPAPNTRCHEVHHAGSPAEGEQPCAPQPRSSVSAPPC